MAYTANTAFEVKVTSSAYNGTQTVAGKFGSFGGSTFTPADCSAGTLVTRHSLIPCEGYEGVVDGSNNPRIYNGNTWYMIAAANGAAGGRYGDHTGIYALNNYDVNKVVSGDIKVNFGIDTLGLGLAAGERGDFLELIVGEQYKFGAGNFTSTPTVGQYVTISGGSLAPSATVPAGGTGVYGIVRRAEEFNEGASYFGMGYVVEIARTAEVEPEA